MATVTHADLRKLVDELPEEELEVAQDTLKGLLREPDEQQKRKELHRRLLASGLVDRIPRPQDVRKPRTFKPIYMSGKLISETLIEERC